MVREGIDVILDIDTQGARQIKSSAGKAIFIFIRSHATNADVACRLPRREV
jgi:guanylate kinase